jgi:hypothetical protein
MSGLKGGILVHDDGVKIYAVTPTADGQVIISKHDTDAGVEYTNISNTLIKLPIRIINHEHTSVLNVSYETVITFAYVADYGAIDSIEVVSWMGSGASSYDVRIYDDTNSQIISEITYTNTSITLNDMSPLANVPTENALIQVQIKRTGGLLNNAAYLNAIIFKFI